MQNIIRLGALLPSMLERQGYPVPSQAVSSWKTLKINIIGSETRGPTLVLQSTLKKLQIVGQPFVHIIYILNLVCNPGRI